MKLSFEKLATGTILSFFIAQGSLAHTVKFQAPAYTATVHIVCPSVPNTLEVHSNPSALVSNTAPLVGDIQLHDNDPNLNFTASCSRPRLEQKYAEMSCSDNLKPSAPVHFDASFGGISSVSVGGVAQSLKVDFVRGPVDIIINSSSGRDLCAVSYDFTKPFPKSLIDALHHGDTALDGAGHGLTGNQKDRIASNMERENQQAESVHNRETNNPVPAAGSCAKDKPVNCTPENFCRVDRRVKRKGTDECFEVYEAKTLAPASMTITTSNVVPNASAPTVR